MDTEKVDCTTMEVNSTPWYEYFIRHNFWIILIKFEQHKKIFLLYFHIITIVSEFCDHIQFLSFTHEKGGWMSFQEIHYEIKT